MPRLLMILALAAAAMPGCGVQRGRFTATGERSVAVLPVPGFVQIVSGYGPAPDGTTNSPQNLLYLLVICPGIQVQGSGSSTDYGEKTTRINHTFETPAGILSLPVIWDRQADTVEVGGRVYPRERGNVFLVRREPNGKLESQQLPDLGPSADFPDVLRHVREHTTNDSLLASLKLVQPH